MNEQSTREGLTTADLAGVERPGDQGVEVEDQDQAGRVASSDMSRESAPDTRTPSDGTMASAAVSASGGATPLFAPDAAGTFRARWGDVQAGFVDEPRGAVQQADSLVAEVMKSLAETFATERTNLENQWSRGDNVSTEDLRLALQRYRSFFDRLLSI